MRESAGLAVVCFALAASMVVLWSCAPDPQGGYQPTTQRAGNSGSPMPFNDVNAQCWTESMNIAGYAASMPQLNTYEACMARNGWEDRRKIF